MKEKYPQYYADYVCIYNKNDITYWIETEEKIEKLSKDFDVPFVNYFYHAKIRKNNGRSHD